MMFSKKPKMKYCIMAIIIVLCFCLSACQKTPDSEIVKPKNIEVEAESTSKIQTETVKKRLNIPLDWREKQS